MPYETISLNLLETFCVEFVCTSPGAENMAEMQNSSGFLRFLNELYGLIVVESTCLMEHLAVIIR